MGVIRTAASEPFILRPDSGPGICCADCREADRPDVPPVHLHTPTGRTYCGAPPPADRATGWTAWRSDCTCSACLATLSHRHGCLRPGCSGQCRACPGCLQGCASCDPQTA